MATEGGLRLGLDIWHPDCWTLEVTAEADAGLLGHGVHAVDGHATGRFTAYADTEAGVETLVAAIEASPHTHSVWETEETTGGEAAVPGEATRSLLVEYDLEKSINDALVSRGFIPDEPVRMVAGREYWTVLVRESRETVQERLDAVRAEMDAEVVVDLITSPEAGVGALPTTDLSERQREVFELARRRNYYSWPREVTAADLAEEVGVSKATLLEHLRKAEAKLLGR
jgi:predicted DNA binding protein